MKYSYFVLTHTLRSKTVSFTKNNLSFKYIQRPIQIYSKDYPQVYVEQCLLFYIW